MTAATATAAQPESTASFDLKAGAIALLAGVVGTIAVGQLSTLPGLKELEKVASAPLLATPGIYAYLRRRRGLGGLLPAGVVTQQGYGLAWPVTIMLGSVVIIGTANLVSGAMAFLTGSLDAALGASAVTALVASFAVGRWIGMRSATHALLAAILTAYLARFGAAVLDMALVDEATRKSLGLQLTPEFVASLILWATIWAVAAVVGCMVGLRGRDAGYLAYLLKRVSPATGKTILDLAYEESAKATETSA
jgi:hypothetical protein